MNILHTVEFYWPSVGGAQEVVRQISEQLVRHGHSVTVATTYLPERRSRNINGVKVVEFYISGNAVRGFRGEIELYQQFLMENRFDVMMNYAAQQWATDLVFPIIDSIPYAKVLAPCGFSALYDPHYAGYFAQMPEVMRKYDRLIFHAENYRDINFAREAGLDNYVIIPNGSSQAEFDLIDPTFRQRYGIMLDAPMLLTVGSHTSLKGHRLVIQAFQELSIGKATLVIIGNTLSSLGCLPDCQRRAWWVNAMSRGRRRVLLLNPPRADVVAAYHAADLFVFGSNVEYSPLVLFEAMASRTPFITLASGNAVEIVAWSGSGIIAPTIRKENGYVDGDPHTFASVINGLLQNPDRMTELAEIGYKAWRERFTWEQIAVLYEKLYQSLITIPPK